MTIKVAGAVGQARAEQQSRTDDAEDQGRRVYIAEMAYDDQISPTTLSPETGAPVILPSWLAIIRIAMPIR